MKYGLGRVAWGQALGFFGYDYTGFAVIRILFGFSEGPVYAVITKTMSAWAAPKLPNVVYWTVVTSSPATRSIAK